MKTIVFDLDETLVKSNLVTDTSKDLFEQGYIDRIYNETEIADVDFSNFPPFLKKVILSRLKDPYYAVWKKVPIEGTIYLLSYLKSLDIKIIILTSRPANLHRDTKDYVKSILSPYISDVLFCNNTDTFNSSKLDYLISINPIMFFDDMVKYVEESLSAGINTCLISNKRTPWNHSFNNSNIIRLKNACFINPDTIHNLL